MNASTPLSGIPGIAVVGSRLFRLRQVFSFRFDSSADTNTAAAVVDEIVGSRMLVFVDPLYPIYEGAAILAVRDGDAFLAQSGGSVWEGAWAAVSREELVAYLTLCMEFHRIESGRPFTISQPIDTTRLMDLYNPRGRINRSPWARFRSAMASRLGRLTYRQQQRHPFAPVVLIARARSFWREMVSP